MKILIVCITVIIAAFGMLSFYVRKNKKEGNDTTYGPFTIKMDVTKQRKLNGNFKWITETKVAYSVWYKGKVIGYPGALENNTGYAHLWKVYILGGAPTPTLIVGSQSLFMITEQNGKAVATPLNEQNDDFASLQFLDEKNDAPGKVENIYMAHEPEPIKTINGGQYLFISLGQILHVPTLQLTPSIKMNQEVDGYHFLKVGGAVAISADKQSLVFMGSKITSNNEYDYAMIVYNTGSKKVYTLPYNRTLTRSVDLNYENREWFATYFEWIKTGDGDKLQLRKYDVLPYWKGSYEDNGVVYQLTPIKDGLKQVFIDFILKELQLTNDAILPPEQYKDNHVFIKYKDQIFNVWLRPEDSVLLLMMKNNYVPEAVEGIKMIHTLGDHFNKELSTGKYQEYFTQLKGR